MKKFLSLILALTLVASLCAVNVMADGPTVHTMTINADKTTELAAGDKVTVEVALDDSMGLCYVKYDLLYDTDIFVADTTKVPPVPAGVENCVDKTWLSGIKDSGANWGMFLGLPTYNAGIAGQISFSWAGTYSVMEGYNDTNKVIGKFYLTVKDGVADGTTGTISLVGLTSDNGQVTADVVCAPITVTVGAAAPSNPTVGNTTNGLEEGEKYAGVAVGEKIYDNAIAVNATITPVATTTEIGVVFAPQDWLGSNELTAVLDGVRVAKKTGVTGGVATTIKAALKDIPRKLNDTEFVMVTRAYAYDGTTYTYANAAETTMFFTKTAE